MKAILLSVFILFFTYYFAIGQDSLYIFKSGSIVSKHALSDIDSITFSLPDNTIVNLQDTLFSPQGSPGIYNIDVDNDGTIDFNIFCGGYDDITYNIYYTYITSMNNYEISTENIIIENKHYCGGVLLNTTFLDTIVPNIYLKKNIIKNSHLFINGKTFIAKKYNFSSSLNDCVNGYKYDRWISDEFKYIAYRKVHGTNTYLGWIKLKVIDYNYIILISYKIPKETESLIIE